MFLTCFVLASRRRSVACPKVVSPTLLLPPVAFLALPLCGTGTLASSAVFLATLCRPIVRHRSARMASPGTRVISNATLNHPLRRARLRLLSLLVLLPTSAMPSHARSIFAHRA
jgi:hypothetical protein